MAKRLLGSSKDGFQYRKRYGLHAIRGKWRRRPSPLEVSIPQAVWIACNKSWVLLCVRNSTFQYRKRYGLHAMKEGKPLTALRTSFNTASGMDCMQSWRHPRGNCFPPVSIPQAVWIACNQESLIYCSLYRGFNTASGMDCMQSGERACVGLSVFVSIPQAVWIACNERRQTINSIEDEFQYRKRYGLHAILTTSERELFSSCFNTASGMDCMQCS